MIELQDIFQIQTDTDFNKVALEIFRFQATNNRVYRTYLQHLAINPHSLKYFKEIPFLPISFFKTHKIITADTSPEQVFISSGTTGQITSKHYVSELKWYENSYLNTFEEFYGCITDYCILALLPSYLERKGSSLIYMVQDLIKKSGHKNSGFFLHNHHELYETLLDLKSQNQKTLLIGVSFALLDFVEKFELSFPELIIMETGGMKGKRKELIREELHDTLCKGFNVNKIHAEYGMTELLSQAYSKGNGQFQTPAHMKILIRDPNDPLSLQTERKSGGINIIDLANINSCSFIATQDLGRVNANGNFEILGRFDNSDIRGCNLMIE